MEKVRRVNFDYSAATPVDPEVLKAMVPFFTEMYGNPSSSHYMGKLAKETFSAAQNSVGKIIGAKNPKSEIYFTSSPTESNNLALSGVAFKNRKRGNHIVISAIEHISVINISKYLERNGFHVTRIPVDCHGIVNIGALRDSITEKTILSSIMLANNEIGTVQPIDEIGKITKESGVIMHVDATAAIGKVPVNVDRSGIDLITIPSNDIHGPKGIGGLYVRDGTPIEPIIQGGGQQNGLRSGSENIPGIVGMAKAADLAIERMSSDSERISRLRDRITTGILESVDQTYLHGHPKNRLPSNAMMRVFGVEGESIVMELDSHGVATSTGSVCASKNLEPSHVLVAIGLNEIERHGSIQFTLSRLNTDNEVDYLLSIMPKIVSKLRSLSPVWKFRDRLEEFYGSDNQEERHLDSIGSNH